MELRDAHMIRSAWGNKPCPHGITVKETISGEPTGNKVCIDCGKVFQPDPAR